MSLEVCRPGPVQSLARAVGPVEGTSRQQHVSDQRLDGCLAHQAHEEQLGDEGGGDGTQGRQPQQQTPKALGLRRVLGPHILSEGHLGLLLQALHVRWVREATGIWETRERSEEEVAGRHRTPGLTGERGHHSGLLIQNEGTQEVGDGGLGHKWQCWSSRNIKVASSKDDDTGVQAVMSQGWRGPD